MSSTMSRSVLQCLAMLYNALQCWCEDRKKNLPVVDALVAHVTTVSTSDGTARSNSVSVSTDVEVRNLHIKFAKYTNIHQREASCSKRT